MKRVVSIKMSVILLLLLALSMAVATFVENDFGTLVARAFVYEAWWFELIMIWLSINFLFHIKRYRLFSKSKLPVGLLHLAFILIIIGAGVTRYFSKEGMVHIRENQTVTSYTTNEKYIQFQTENAYFYKKSQPIPYFFSEETMQIDDNDNHFECVLTEYLPKAVQKFVDGEESFLEIVMLETDEESSYHLMKSGQSQKVDNYSLAFQSDEEHVFKIQKNENNWQLWSAIPLHTIHLESQQMSSFSPQQWTNVMPHTVYRWSGGSFMIEAIHDNKKLVYEPLGKNDKAEKEVSVVKLEVRNEGKLITESYFSATKNIPEWQWFDYQGERYAYTYASKQIDLPFALKLNKFHLKRYPGSESAESYTSYVEVIDGDKSFSYNIFMNNVLDYQSYRFYQSSYDKDEKGTLLSLNKDREGTIITYLGYGVLFFAMFWLLFAYGSRFSFLNRNLKKIKTLDIGKLHSVLFMFFVLPSFAQSGGYLEEHIIPQEKAQEYGRLIVQDFDGRMKPLTTLAYEITRKLTGKTSVNLNTHEGKKIQISPEQFLIALQKSPETFAEKPLININTDKGAIVFNILNVNQKRMLQFTDFLDASGAYLLKDVVEETNRLKPAQRSESQKELLKVDERFNILYNVFTGNFLRLYPNTKSQNNKWLTADQFSEFEEQDADFVKNIHNFYIAGLEKGMQTNDFSEADQALSYLATYQKEAGKNVYPTKNEVEAEIFYTRTRIGNYLFGICILLGGVLLIFNILSLFLSAKWLQKTLTVGSILACIIWVVFTFDLGLRWYIAKHPPWSDGFEMLLFVSWGILLFGLLFVRKSSFTLPLGLLFSGTLLLVSFLDWLNPEITTLKPVLYSYWLKIHVTVIVGSYAPLGLSFVIALLSMILLIFKPLQPKITWWRGMQEMIVVQEMAVTIGLFLLTAGTFLGGIWANESWGRYWAWDPKETWALISIIVYSVVVHLRLIPKFRNALVYYLVTMWAFSTIVMTSFGVNYYLVGLHSYATGDPIPIPKWVYFVVALLVVISVFAWYSYKKMPQEERNKLYSN
ncbi:cytochrome c biogenesis protein CcsA [Capnocytophaga canis]|uniref:cytochrome c biogenesis protein CcsA n=1 Tax=Capnocytophaga canis TaxID=1848903 RepID=UPI0037D38A58